MKNRDHLFESELNSYTIYNKNEDLIEFGKCYTDGSILKKTIYERVTNGNIQKTIEKKASGETLSYWTYKYDSNDNLIEIKTYDAENNLTDIQSNTYDKNENNTEIVFKKPNSNIGKKYVYKYNADNKKLKN
ncbi:hypothetical protein [Formosa algae]|uniref:YD repeat-containing protein n=1 Tax=Formosa algae TaxID=225843 RepID=A0A9X0YPY6_9FLAO|nr:hypothetical protein [Formosa algae]MBP1841574.1 YD repeat-containing protein [Formosa algae]MDQ0337033.1 YD repeat-containing protein [Formosa algae]OEI80199.1 hypothetical protein AST99_10450 [Formosa algae]PNW27697.1 hypothetical protein BKP44_12035 [Formosa algae]